MCLYCGYGLSDESGAEPEKKGKIDKKVFLRSMVRTIIVLLLLYCFSLISTLGSLLLIAWLAVREVKAVIEITRTNMGRLKKTLVVVCTIIPGLWFIGIIVISVDSEPIRDDYTVADLCSARPEYAESHDLLKSLANEQGGLGHGAPGIGLSQDDVNAIRACFDATKDSNCEQIGEVVVAYEVDIERAWEKSKEARLVIDRLDRFPEIADLTEPDLNAKFPPLGNLRLLMQLYSIHAILDVQSGQGEAAVGEFIKLDSVVRKLSKNSRSTVTKLVCIGCMYTNVLAANYLVNSPLTSESVLEVLEAHYAQLTDEQLSLRNLILYEYLIFKNSVVNGLPFVRGVRAVKNVPFLKRHSTLRVYRNWLMKELETHEGCTDWQKPQLRVWPWLYPDFGSVTIDSEGKVPWYYKCYDPVGSMVISIFMPALNRFYEIRTELKMEIGLFQIVMGMRQGKEVSAEGVAEGDGYTVDLERKVIFSPGPDGEVGTDDDIELPINPELLGCTD